MFAWVQYIIEPINIGPNNLLDSYLFRLIMWLHLSIIMLGMPIYQIYYLNLAYEPKNIADLYHSRLAFFQA